MKLFTLIVASAFFVGCATTNVEPSSETTVDVAENDKIAVCGEVAADKQTYPTLGDLHSDGAKFLYYGPCYE